MLAQERDAEAAGPEDALRPVLVHREGDEAVAVELHRLEQTPSKRRPSRASPGAAR